MKKKAKKLGLAKETLRNLNIVPGHIVAGNLTTTDGCPYTADISCASASCDWTCGCQSNVVVCIHPQTTVC